MPCPPSINGGQFDVVKEKNLPFTIHAGENGSHKEIELASLLEAYIHLTNKNNNSLTMPMLLRRLWQTEK